MGFSNSCGFKAFRFDSAFFLFFFLEDASVDSLLASEAFVYSYVEVSGTCGGFFVLVSVKYDHFALFPTLTSIYCSCLVRLRQAFLISLLLQSTRSA